MGAPDSSLVRLSKATIVLVDQRRGKVPRARYLTGLVERDGKVAEIRAEHPRRMADNVDRDPRPADCRHPVNRRLGDRCAACGTTIAAPPSRRR